MPEYKEHPGYYSITPATVRYDKRLSPSAKLLYGEITALCNKEGYCWASNAYFAGLYEVDRSSVTKWVNLLKEAGYIRVDYVYSDDNTRIKERRIFLTEKMPVLQNRTGGGEKTQQGGELIHHPPGEKTQRGGEKTQERILHLNITNSAAAEKNEPETEAAADCTDDDQKTALPEPGSADIADLKPLFKTLDPSLIFDEVFYPKAFAFLASNSLDSGYLSWLYDRCVKKKPQNLAGYYYSVFFEGRFVELYREHERSRPPQADNPVSCPVCSTVHKSGEDCPHCGLSRGDGNDKKRIEEHKRFFALPEDKREAYKNELDRVFETSRPGHFDETAKRIKAVKEKYGL